MKRRMFAVVLVLLAGGCAAEGSTPDPTASAPASAVTTAPAVAPSRAVPQPRFADLTQGSTTSVVNLHGYDAENASAVVEPILFMTGDAYCRAFKIKRTDGRCVNLPYVTEDSRTRVTVPIAATVEYFTWEGADGTVCVDAPEKGGTCPMSGPQFAEWFDLHRGSMVAVATEDGVITRMAVLYTP